jgi:hypothetical protein
LWDRLVWGGHSCPPLLTSILIRCRASKPPRLTPCGRKIPKAKAKSTAADKSVRPTPAVLAEQVVQFFFSDYLHSQFFRFVEL